MREGCRGKDHLRKTACTFIALCDPVHRRSGRLFTGSLRRTPTAAGTGGNDGSLAKQLVPQGITCIIDHGHWTRDSRRQIIDACRADGLPYRRVWLTCPRGIRLQRLKQRNEQVRSSGEKGYVIDAEQLERFDSWFEELSEEERMHAEILETGNS